MEFSPQPLAEHLSIQNVDCRIAIRPAHSEPAKQREVGGSVLALEFEGDDNRDLIVAAREGFELMEDFLSAVSLTSGLTLGQSTLVQVARRTAGTEENCEFVQFLSLGANHWPEVISKEAIRSARNLLAHWDGLESGKRLRRAARRYREAAGTLDDVSAFLDASTGLEALEPPLARARGLTPGTEEVKGACEKCGNEFTRKRTTLVGVRAFVLDGEDISKADEQRKADWKAMNSLRNEVTHGLIDDTALGRRPHDALLPSMHYLHDAISICSHAISEPTERFRLARGATQYLLLGRYTAVDWGPLAEWGEIIETSAFEWVHDEVHGLVPEISIRNRGLKDLQAGPGRLTQPLSFATMAGILPANSAIDAGASSDGQQRAQ
jgi:hypothetical protein